LLRCPPLLLRRALSSLLLRFSLSCRTRLLLGCALLCCPSLLLGRALSNLLLRFSLSCRTRLLLGCAPLCCPSLLLGRALPGLLLGCPLLRCPSLLLGCALLCCPGLFLGRALLCRPLLRRLRLSRPLLCCPGLLLGCALLCRRLLRSPLLRRSRALLFFGLRVGDRGAVKGGKLQQPKAERRLQGECSSATKERIHELVSSSAWAGSGSSPAQVWSRLTRSSVTKFRVLTWNSGQTHTSPLGIHLALMSRLGAVHWQQATLSGRTLTRA
jgi:hypothetical protein